eukprot:Lankesteria_metandrocarpae@DN3555_c0_g1_i1.p1
MKPSGTHWALVVICAVVLSFVLWFVATARYALGGPNGLFAYTTSYMNVAQYGNSFIPVASALPKPALHCAGRSQREQLVYFEIEKSLFSAAVRRDGVQYFEWGLGGSTVNAAPYVSKGASVDHYRIWCDNLIQDPTIECAKAAGTYQIICLELSEITESYGRVDKKDLGLYEPYVNAIKVYAEQQMISTFNVVHVDGRFRVACAATAWQYMDGDSILLVHDYSRRPAYHVLETVFNQETQFLGFKDFGVYGVLTKRVGVDPSIVQKLIDTYMEVQA